MPDPQTWLTIYAGFSFGTPDNIEACLAGFCPAPPVNTGPSMTSSTSPLFIFEILTDSLITADPNSWPGTFFKLLFKEPTAVLTAEVINTFFINLIYIFILPFQLNYPFETNPLIFPVLKINKSSYLW